MMNVFIADNEEECRKFFHSACIFINKKLDFRPDDRFIEPDLLFLLTYIKANPHMRDVFAQLFVDLVQGTFRPAPPEILGFCMRDLKFPEVKAALQSELKKDDPRLWSFCSSVLEVYDEAWPCTEFYQYYSKYFFDDLELPSGFKYPKDYLRLVRHGLTSLVPWFILEGEELQQTAIKLQQLYPEQHLVPFAKRHDNMEVVCWRSPDSLRIFLINLPNSVDAKCEGFNGVACFDESQTFATFNDWLRIAIEDYIAYKP